MPEQKPSLFTRIKNDWKSLPPIAKTAIKIGGFVAAGAAIAIVGVATLGAAPAIAVAGFAVAAGVTFAAGGYKAFKKDSAKTPAHQAQQASLSRGQSQGIIHETSSVIAPAQTANLDGVNVSDNPLRVAVQKTTSGTPHNAGAPHNAQSIQTRSAGLGK